MKTSINHLDSEGSEEWLNELLQSIKRIDAETISSADFDRRCVAAVTSALHVSQMRQHRQNLANTPGSLAEYFQTLARKAGVKLDAVFETLGISRADPPNVDSARGLAQLARYLGLTRDEAVLRLRWGFARAGGGSEPPNAWPYALEPVRARRRRGVNSIPKNLDQTLRRCEAAYSAELRADLRAAISSFAEEYGKEMV